MKDFFFVSLKEFRALLFFEVKKNLPLHLGFIKYGVRRILLYTPATDDQHARQEGMSNHTV